MFLSLEQRRFKLWNFVTQWGVAKNLLHSGFHRVVVHALKAEESDCATVRIELPLADDEGVEVWPRVFQRPPAQRQEGPPCPCDAPRARPRRQATG
eukprot:6873402-Lingulodinium_polyedra.AAC.2